MGGWCDAAHLGEHQHEAVEACNLALVAITDGQSPPKAEGYRSNSCGGVLDPARQLGESGGLPALRA